MPSAKASFPKLTDQVGLFLHADCAPVSQAYLEERCAKLQQLFTQRGYNGTLKENTAKWEAENRVPASQVQSALSPELMVTARELTGRFLPLPEAHYHCVTERGGAFSAPQRL